MYKILLFVEDAVLLKCIAPHTSVGRSMRTRTEYSLFETGCQEHGQQPRELSIVENRLYLLHKLLRGRQGLFLRFICIAYHLHLSSCRWGRKIRLFFKKLG